MELLANSVIREAKHSDSNEEEDIRLLAIDADNNRAVVISTNSATRAERPRLVSLSQLTERLDVGELVFVPEENTRFQLSDDLLSKRDISDRDKRYDCIAPLVTDQDFLWKYAGSKRVRGIGKQAKLAGASRTALYYWLTTFYRNGQTKQGLLPNFHLCGGPGIEKQPSEKKMGRPVKQPMGSHSLDPGLNVSEKEKHNIERIILDHYATTKAPTLEDTYIEFLDKYNDDEVETAAQNGEEAPVITRRQFVYWAHQRCDWNDVCRRRLTESEFESNHRALNSTVRSQVFGPGDRYETDSTPAPVHLVAADNRHDPIGKPNTYFVIDEYTSYITGMHTCLEAPSWRQSAQAFNNSFCDKVAYCARFGIEIEQEDWPARYLPQRILCDRGENISEAAEYECQKLGIVLEFTPPYRGDRKPIVERYWKTASDEFWNSVLGTTGSKPRARGQKDPRLEAALNFREFTRLTILKVLDLNRYRKIADLLTPEMIERDIAPTPHNAWRLSLETHRHSLSAADEMQVRSQLMERDSASVTERGILFRGIHYTCDVAEQERWYERARREGRWKLEVRFDSSWTSEIYIRVPNSKTLTHCRVRDFERLKADKSFADVAYIDDFLKRKERDASEVAAKIRFKREVERTVENALEEKAATPCTKSKTARVKNIRENRDKEIAAQAGASGKPTKRPPQNETHRPELIAALRKGPRDV